MGDWADDLANDLVRDIRAGLLDEPALAMKLRTIDANAEAKGNREGAEFIRETTLQMEEILKHQRDTLGGGDK